MQRRIQVAKPNVPSGYVHYGQAHLGKFARFYLDVFISISFLNVNL
jgi:hypothetical protein